MIEQKAVNPLEINDFIKEGWVVKFATDKYAVMEREKQNEVPEMKAEDIIKPLSPLDDIDEDEILYWSTPYYDELQARKHRQQESIKQEVRNG